MNNNCKRHFDIDSDAVQSNNEDEIDELINNFDTEFIAPEEIDQGTTHTK